MPEHTQVPYKETRLYRIRHSASHVLAQAVVETIPGAKFAIGPPIADGFYYDFELPRTLTPDDLGVVEQRMKAILRGRHPFTRKELAANEAKQLFADQPFKVELIEGLEQGSFDEDGNPVAEKPPISIYTHGTFTDLCGGPHVENTGELDPDGLKLLHVAGAYWRGDVRRPMLQRIYGTAWENQEQLEQYLHRLEEAKKRDHRRLGTDLDLFITSESVGPGLVLWTPKGGMVRYVAERFSQEAHLLNGYSWVYTPHIGRANLWETSGHLQFRRHRATVRRHRPGLGGAGHGPQAARAARGHAGHLGRRVRPHRLLPGAADRGQLRPRPPPALLLDVDRRCRCQPRHRLRRDL
jgi:threonyl-tRNA synthetase